MESNGDSTHQTTTITDILENIKTTLSAPYSKFYRAPKDVNLFRACSIIFSFYLMWLSSYSIDNGPIIWLVRSDGEFVSNYIMTNFRKQIYESVGIMQIGYDVGYAHMILISSVLLGASAVLSSPDLAVPIIFLKIFEISIAATENIFGVVNIVEKVGWFEAIYFALVSSAFLLVEAVFTYLTLRYYEEVKRLRYE